MKEKRKGVTHNFPSFTGSSENVARILVEWLLLSRRLSSITGGCSVFGDHDHGMVPLN